MTASTEVGPVVTVLTVAGSDSGGGAGIQADLKTFAALGVYGVSAITAITAQNTMGVTTTLLLPSDIVSAQIEAVGADIDVHAVKTGMLGNAAIVEAVAASIKALDLPNLVVDPVIRATSGDTLLDREGVDALRSELLPLARIVTPNVPEAEALSGRPITSIADRRDAVARISALGPAAVVITGGHGPERDVVDLVFDGAHFHELHTPRVPTRHTHGTGCTFASALAVGLAAGRPVAEAALAAQTFVAGAIRNGLALGRGAGPLDHFWQTRSTRILEP